MSRFWPMAFMVAGIATPFVILWCRHRALKHRVAARRQPTDDEVAYLRVRGRINIIAFVLFWVTSLGLILLTAALRLAPSVQQLVFILVLAMVVTGISFHLSTRCPICRYRIGYQRSLGVPPRCERCGAEFSRNGQA